MTLNEQVKNALDKQSFEVLRLSKIVRKNNFNAKNSSNLSF